MPGTPGTPLWSTTTSAVVGAGAGGAGANNVGGGGGGRRRKTLSPSKALSFLSSSFDGDAENVPPPAVGGNNGAAMIKSLIKVGGLGVCGCAVRYVVGRGLASHDALAHLLYMYIHTLTGQR